MDAYSHSAHGAGRANAPARDLSPRQAKKFFELFRPGTHREVLLLGDLAEQLVHWVKSKGHKVLCAARQGPCELCAQAGESADISTRHSEYLAAALVRPWRDRLFEQRVAVFTAAAGEQVLTLTAGGQQRGQRLDVARAQGSRSRIKVELINGLPAGFPDTLPPEFDLVPWVRARFGKPQDPARPLAFLPPIKCGGPTTRAVAVGRPMPLDLTADDCAAPKAMTPDEAESLLRKIDAAGTHAMPAMREKCEQVLRDAGRPVPTAARPVATPATSSPTARPSPPPPPPAPPAAVVEPAEVPLVDAVPSAIGAAGIAPPVHSPGPRGQRRRVVREPIGKLTEAEHANLKRTLHRDEEQPLPVGRRPLAERVQETLADVAPRTIADKPGAELTSEEAVRGGRVGEYLVAGIGKNGPTPATTPPPATPAQPLPALDPADPSAKKLARLFKVQQQQQQQAAADGPAEVGAVVNELLAGKTATDPEPPATIPIRNGNGTHKARGGKRGGR